jgi:FkbM family methyltransferase
VEHPRDFTIYRNRLKYRSHGSAMSVHAYYTGEVEYHVIRYVVSQMKPGFVILDVGAHHGAYTLIAAHELQSRGWPGHVYSFEPAEENYGLLAYNVRQNGLDDYVTLYCQAVSDTAGQQDFLIHSGDNSGNTLAGNVSFAIADPSRAVTRSVCVTTLDSLADQVQKVDLIKLDIQGAEPRALAGAEAIIRRDRPVLVVEATPSWQQATELIREFLVGHDYSIRGVTARGELCEPNSASAFVSWDWVGIPAGSAQPR